MKGVGNLDLRQKKRLGNTLKRKRRALGMSQEDLAGKLLIERGYISMIETGRKMPSLDTLQALCSALGVKVHALLKEVDI